MLKRIEAYNSYTLVNSCH